MAILNIRVQTLNSDGSHKVEFVSVELIEPVDYKAILNLEMKMNEVSKSRFHFFIEDEIVKRLLNSGNQ